MTFQEWRTKRFSDLAFRMFSDYGLPFEIFLEELQAQRRERPTEYFERLMKDWEEYVAEMGITDEELDKNREDLELNKDKLLEEFNKNVIL